MKCRRNGLGVGGGLLGISEFFEGVDGIQKGPKSVMGVGAGGEENTTRQRRVVECSLSKATLSPPKAATFTSLLKV